MAQISVWHVKFHVGSGPIYSAFVGVSGGSRGDGQTSSTLASVKTAVSSNLASILTAMGANTAAPGGTLVIDDFSHASVPDIWT